MLNRDVSKDLRSESHMSTMMNTFCQETNVPKEGPYLLDQDSIQKRYTVCTNLQCPLEPQLHVFAHPPS